VLHIWQTIVKPNAISAVPGWARSACAHLRASLAPKRYRRAQKGTKSYFAVGNPGAAQRGSATPRNPLSWNPYFPHDELPRSHWAASSQSAKSRRPCAIRLRLHRRLAKFTGVLPARARPAGSSSLRAPEIPGSWYAKAKWFRWRRTLRHKPPCEEIGAQVAKTISLMRSACRLACRK
jgi:hypothetical protein